MQLLLLGVRSACIVRSALRLTTSMLLEFVMMRCACWLFSSQNRAKKKVGAIAC